MTEHNTDNTDVTPILAVTIATQLDSLYGHLATGAIKRLHAGFANEASYFTLRTETGVYRVEVHKEA